MLEVQGEAGGLGFVRVLFSVADRCLSVFLYLYKKVKLPVIKSSCLVGKFLLIQGCKIAGFSRRNMFGSKWLGRAVHVYSSFLHFRWRV